MLYLEISQAVKIAEVLGFSIRDEGLLASALARPAASLFGNDAYESLELKAAALFSSLAQNPPLFDGNKRFAWVLTLTFCEMNRMIVEFPEDEVFDFVLAVAQSRLELEEIAEQLVAHAI